MHNKDSAYLHEMYTLACVYVMAVHTLCVLTLCLQASLPYFMLVYIISHAADTLVGSNDTLVYTYEYACDRRIYVRVIDEFICV